jgi:hypothetical protein
MPSVFFSGLTANQPLQTLWDFEQPADSYQYSLQLKPIQLERDPTNRQLGAVMAFNPLIMSS